MQLFTSLFLLFTSLPTFIVGNLKIYNYSVYYFDVCYIIGNSCTNKFMDYSLLKYKANQICEEDRCDGPLKGHHMGTKKWIMPSQTFTCSGIITGFSFGGDLRPDYSIYPVITLWRANLDFENNTYYEKVSGSECSIHHGIFDMSTTGPFQYNITDSLNHVHFESGDVLGLEHYSNGAVRLYYIDSNDDTDSEIYELISDNTKVSLSDENDVNNETFYRKLLLRPITGIIYFIDSNCHNILSDNYRCLSGFPDEDIIITNSRAITDVSRIKDNTYLYFLGLTLTCSGKVTHVLVGARNLSSVRGQVPFIQLRGYSYEQVSLDINISVSHAVEVSNNLYMINLTKLVPVEKGDHLWLHQPTSSESNFLLYQQELNGPNNYVPFSRLDINNYPLVSFIVGKKHLEILLLHFYRTTFYYITENSFH